MLQLRKAPNQSLHNKIMQTYEDFEAKFQIEQLSNNVTYSSPVNFGEAMEAPRHRWFPYKEGFSPTFASNFINEALGKNKGIVLDPFCGVGTTVIEAAKLGHNGIGFDVSPLAIFISYAKSTPSANGLTRLLEKELTKLRDKTSFDMSLPPDNDTVVRYFEKQYLESLLRLKSFAQSRSDTTVRSLFKLALLTLVEQYSTHRKTGNGVKKKTRLNYGLEGIHPLEEVKLSLIKVVKTYCEDIKSTPLKSTPDFFQTSSAEDHIYANHKDVDVILTSPPYANCFDYSKIYMNELWLGDFFKTKTDQSQFRTSSVRSHVHATWEDRYQEHGLCLVENEIRQYLDEQELWSKRIGDMLSGYFKDLGRTLNLTKKIMRPNGVVGFVVSNSFYGGLPIPTDLLLAELARQEGYKVVKIQVYRKIVPSSQQYKRVHNKKHMRESLVILKV